MTVNAILKTHAAAVVNHAGESATYSPAVGDDVTCKVVLAHDVLIQADGYDASVATLGSTITALVDDVGTVSKGETFLVDGTTYTVVKPESNDNIMITVVVK